MITPASDLTAGRSLPPGLSGIVAELELNQPSVVSLAEIADLARRADLKTPAAIVADRLRRRGWLLPTGQRGIYEFAPGAHAGPHGHGDPFLAFRASRAVSAYDASVALQSALWLRGLCDRAPNQHELAAASAVAVPQSVLRAMRVVRFQAQSEPDLIDGIPVLSTASMLVQLAAKPASVKNWSVFADALPELFDLTVHGSGKPGADTGSTLVDELRGRSAATATRLAYLLSGISPDTSNQLRPRPSAGVVYFGPRQASRRFSSRFNVADTMLPFDPQDLRMEHRTS